MRDASIPKTFVTDTSSKLLSVCTNFTGIGVCERERDEDAFVTENGSNVFKNLIMRSGV